MASEPSVEQQLSDWLSQLAVEHKQILLRMLSADEMLTRQSRIAHAEMHLRELCRTRGMNWEAMNERDREDFLDNLIHEEETFATTVGTLAPTNLRRLCAQCGHDLTPQDLYRIYFSERQPTLGPVVARLVVLDVDGNVQFPVNTEGETIIGRVDPHRGIRPHVDLSKYDHAARVSRRHARIIARQGLYTIEDMGSANGTTVNGKTRLRPQQPVKLTAGDLVKFGETTVKFVG
jgi:predicted component of type VI protein secretion system